jgi:DNA-binding XRE family transcriptional regulator
MTKTTIPEPDLASDPTPDEFAGASRRVREARRRLLSDPKAAGAHDALAAQIRARLEAKEATLAQVRRAVGFTQVQMAEMLDMSQGDISKLEHRENLHLVTLSRFVEATGGRLRICAVYGDTEVVLKVGDLLPAHAEKLTET